MDPTIPPKKRCIAESQPLLTVWGYERVMIYGSMISEYMVPDTFTNDPMEAWNSGARFQVRRSN